MKKVIITGATGMIGKGVLLECLDSDDITEVLTIGRSPVGISHSKLKELLVADFSDFSGFADSLIGYDACYFCLGVSAGGMKEEDYRKVTYDYTLALAGELVSLNPDMTFIYVSGQGTDSTEKGRMMWARVKGKTENDLLNLGFAGAYMFRPGMILPMRGIESRTPAYRAMYKYLGWLVKLSKWMAPRSVTDTTAIGKAMIKLTLKSYPKNIINPSDIYQLAKA